ncbi:efflux RND transporter periplasmic adaptor subunit [Brackiella oedipodis]|uniref:efflux RND transporter periplasmic adaptor subunit n=1 Tax=Brackiella oedipodis TaxID=124225 RepID=UPI00048DF0DD|nr:efflux RND transporter periplasmic adaptor subunit [Brackiella oedipodis]
MKYHQRFQRLGLSTVALTLAMSLAACNQEQQQRQAPKYKVSTVTVSPKAKELFTTLPGQVNAIKDAQVVARVTGNIESINFEQGKEVKKGQLLFQIDPKPYQAEYNQAAANLKQAQALAQSANALSKRYGGLVGSAAVSKQEYDNAKADAAKANASIEQYKAALESARIDLGYTRVTSPIDGIVGKALVTEGALVRATDGTVLALVQQLNEVYVDFNQTVSELSRLRLAIKDGQVQALDGGSTEVEVTTDEGLTYPEKGKLMFTGVTVDSRTGMVQLRSIFPNKDHILLPGMYVTVKLPQGTIKDALTVPTQALQRNSNGTNSLYVVEDGVVKTVNVKTGQETNGETLINSGLKPNSQVVVEGFTKIRPGDKVDPIPWDPNKGKEAVEAREQDSHKGKGETEGDKAEPQDQATPDSESSSNDSAK